MVILKNEHSTVIALNIALNIDNREKAVQKWNQTLNVFILDDELAINYFPHLWHFII